MLLAAAAIGLLAVGAAGGYIIGSRASSSAPNVAEPVPAPTVTVTAQPPGDTATVVPDDSYFLSMLRLKVPSLEVFSDTALRDQADEVCAAFRDYPGGAVSDFASGIASTGAMTTEEASGYVVYAMLWRCPDLAE